MLKKLWRYLTGRCPKCGNELEYLPDDWSDSFTQCKSDDCDYWREG